MNILIIRTDKPESEIGLYKGEKQLAYHTWQAHRRLAETIHKEIDGLLKEHKMELKDLEGIVCYKGPGSFTGLRIGLSVANALAESLGIPIVGTTGEGWLVEGITALTNGHSQRIALPEYGAEPHITQQKR